MQSLAEHTRCEFILHIRGSSQCSQPIWIGDAVANRCCNALCARFLENNPVAAVLDYAATPFGRNDGQAVRLRFKLSNRKSIRECRKKMEIKPETIATERPLHLAGKSTHHNCAGVRCNIARLLCDGRGLRRKCLSTARPIAAETSGSLLLIPNLFVELHVRTAKLRANGRALANLSRDRMAPPSPIANGFVAAQ